MTVMKNYTWILDGQLFPYIKGNGGVSASYLLPKTQALSRVEDLAGATLWIILRDGGSVDHLFARVHISAIEQFEDGYNNGDFLLSIDQARSCRVVFDADWGEEARLTETKSFGKGVWEISAQSAASLESYLRKTIFTNFRKPSDSMLDKIEASTILEEDPLFAKKWISAVSSKFSLREIWATKSPIELSPFAHFAYLALEKTYGREKALSFVSELNELDPTANGQKHSESRGSDRPIFAKGIVDTNLTPIDVNKLYARRFIAKETSAIDMKEVLGKIEASEKRHQDMLRDISAHLISIGYSPLQSSSIDLSVEIGKWLVVFELKSANLDNLFSQSAKGSFQLFCYKSALVENGRDVFRSVLILERTASDSLNEYVMSILSQAHVRTLFYDSSQNWPDRLPGLSSVLDEDVC